MTALNTIIYAQRRKLLRSEQKKMVPWARKRASLWKAIATESNAKEVKFSEKDAEAEAEAEAEEEVVVRDSMAEMIALQALEVAKEEAVGGGGGMEAKEKLAAAAVGAETSGGGITGTEMQGSITTESDVTLQELEVTNEEVTVRNSVAAMITEAFALAEEEAAVGGTGATLGDMEVALRSIKKPSPIPSPSQHGHSDGSVGLRRGRGGMAGLLRTPINTKSAVEIFYSRSPTSQFEYIMDATHQTLDFDSLHKSYSVPLFDDNKSITSEETSLTGNVEASISSDEVSTPQKEEDNGPDSEFVDKACFPMDCVTDFMFCRLQCAFPDMVDDVDEILSNDMYNIFFQCEGEGEGEEEAGGEAKAGAFSLKLFGEVDDTREKGGVETVLSPRTDEHQDREGEGGVDEQGDDEVEEGREVVVDERKDLWDVIVVFDEQGEDEEAQLQITSYSPEAGLVRKEGRLPEPSEDEVLIRVDATTISTRDYLERLRRNRDTNVKLKDDLWVPGHEIVGRVVRAGVNAEFLLDERIAALLPYGGGCSQYACIDANNVITLPEEAGSDEIVALLSTYMTAYQCLESVVGIAPEEEGDVDEKGDIESQKIPSIVGDAGQKTSPLLGKNVLVVGAGSPVGLALVDLARNAGATVYTLLGSRSSLSTIRNMGAHNWYSLSQKEVWEAEWRGKMDLIVDKVGDSDYHSSFYTVLKTRGRLVRMSITSCEKKYEPSQPLESQGEQGFGLLNRYKERVIKDKSIDYDIFHSFYEDKESFTEDLIYLHDLLQIGKIRPKIFSRVGFDELEGEWEKVMTGETNGGVVVVLPGRLEV